MKVRITYLASSKGSLSIIVILICDLFLSACTEHVVYKQSNGSTLNSIFCMSIEQTLFACPKGESFKIQEGLTVYPGVAKAILVGGNLESLVALMGTPFQCELKNRILLVEDVGAEPYQVDSRLAQLDLAGIFEQIAGVIFGLFTRCDPKYFPERDGTVDDVIVDWS